MGIRYSTRATRAGRKLLDLAQEGAGSGAVLLLSQRNPAAFLSQTTGVTARALSVRITRMATMIGRPGRNTNREARLGPSSQWREQRY